LFLFIFALFVIINRCHGGLFFCESLNKDRTPRQGKPEKEKLFESLANQVSKERRDPKAQAVKTAQKLSPKSMFNNVSQFPEYMPWSVFLIEEIGSSPNT
jgi:hypothetical protein